MLNKITNQFQPFKILGVIIIVFCLLNCSRTYPKPAKIEKLPNILFIISDDLSAEALGVYGNEQCLTPHIDRIAQEGLLFTRAYCQFPVCGPSRAALLSGLYPERIGIMSNGQSNNISNALDSFPSMPEHFRTNGYHTTRLGKIYHMRVPGDITAGVDGPDHPESWSEKYNFQGPEWMSTGSHEHLSNEKLRFEKDIHYNLGFGSAFYTVKTQSNGSGQPDYRAASKAINILKNHKDVSDKPLFLAVGFVRPHVPLVAPKSDFDMYPYKEINLPEKIKNDQNDIPPMGISRTTDSYGIADPQTQQKVLRAYYASVSFMDSQVGRIMNTVRELGMENNTIVIFTSDHGYHLGEHDFWQKLSLHEESSRIPIIIRGPGIKHSKTDALTEQIDLYPTLCELAGIPIPDHVQGLDLSPVINNSKQEVREAAYCVNSKGAMIRTRKWSYIKYHDGSEELYDMINDENQFINLGDNSEYKNIRLDLKKLMVSHKRRIMEHH